MLYHAGTRTPCGMRAALRVVHTGAAFCPFSSMYHADTKTLLATGGDGFLSVYDMRRRAMHAVSDNMEDELLSVVLVKHGQKVITGTQEGVLYIFSWGNWGDCTDRFPGHPESVETMLVIDEETICTGSSDGLIRIVSILPNKLLGERWPASTTGPYHAAPRSALGC